MLYKKNNEYSLNKSLFKSPTSEYRGTPFWAWNSYLKKDELERQIDIFNEMGLGGFHMHVRTGLENEYLSDEYMSLVKSCVEKAKKNNMLAWLYDEDRWPSGAAGGIVTKEEKYRSRCLLFTPFENAESYMSTDSRADAGRNENGKLLACYDIVLDKNGYLSSYRLIDKSEKVEGTKWYAFLEISTSQSWYNGQTYADTLNKKAIERFIEVTHEKYKNTIGDDFDKTVPAIFTDEPQFTRKRVLNSSFDLMDVGMPWTDKVPEIYKELYNSDIFETLPEIFWDLPDGIVSVARYRYHDMISELFTRSFADTIGEWCKNNNIYLTGHMMEEPSLHSQTAALGEAMRSYRGFQLPGIDMLCNNHEFTTAKQAQSACHQFGREGVLSELYGVTGWDCDFRTYKHQGDWQACLGVTVRVPHLSWYSMKGEAKRDYPASIHYQSPWYKEYKIIEDHFARVNTALTRGKPVVKVGVIHPVESYWLHWGPNDKSALLRDSLDDRFMDVTKWLLEGSIDFDFISESLLPGECKNASYPLCVGEMEYDVIIVPGCETLRKATYNILNQFKSAGGKLVIMGNAPALCEAVPSDNGRKLSENAVNIDFSRSSLLQCLEENRTITIRYSDGKLGDRFIYQLRQDNDCRWLFIANAYEPYNKDVDRGSDIMIILEGEYTAELYDTQSGNICPVKTEYQNGKTIIKTVFYGYDSLLYKLKSGKTETVYSEEKIKPEILEVIEQGRVNYELSEPNVLLLDYAEYKLDFENEFSKPEEVLRLDNICREKLNIPNRNGGIVQPYVTGKVPSTNTLTLKFTFESEIDYSGAELALEDAETANIVFNGTPVKIQKTGYYVDLSISKIRLPDIVKGINTLIVSVPFGKASNTENMFILGNFGVKCTGRNTIIIPAPEKISFGGLTGQGFPFYGGTVKYKFMAVSKNGKLLIRASDYRGALICVSVDGKKAGYIVYPPYILSVDNFTDGEHEIELELFIHRYNTFGPVHLVNVKESWHGPDAWRSKGDNWSYEYVLRETGILSSPAISNQ
ncbi:MAG: hypothetical protein IJK60_02855 [Clostridia bacterium]|nr:hypothetical protein [Clostridia bacterium]